MPSPPARSLNDKVLSLESKLEKEQQELKEGQAPAPRPPAPGVVCAGGHQPSRPPGQGHRATGDSSSTQALPPRPTCVRPGHSDALLRVQQLARGLKSLTCQMAALKSNGEGCAGAGPPFLLVPAGGRWLRPSPPPPRRLSKHLLSP